MHFGEVVCGLEESMEEGTFNSREMTIADARVVIGMWVSEGGRWRFEIDEQWNK
jgi:uncharacterized cupin superfamily protein